MPLNDLARSYACHKTAIEEAASAVLRSGWYVHGPQHEAFEHELGQLLGVGCLGVGSGTDALELAIRAVTADRGGAVLTAANAGGYASTAIHRSGRRAVYCDIDAATLCLDPDAVEANLGQGLAAVVVTHLYGRMAPVEAIVERCTAHGVPVVEDCAQAIGARRAGAAAGSVGTAAAFSFYPTKNLGALGDGGAVTTGDPEVAERVQRLRQYGWGAKYTVEEPGGINSRLDELQAAILRVRLPSLGSANEARRTIIGRYVEAAAGGPLRMLPASGPDHTGHLAVGIVEVGDREAVLEHMAAAHIQTDVHYPVPDHLQPAWAHEHPDLRLPVTERAAQCVLSLPCFPELTADEVERVCDALRSLS